MGFGTIQSVSQKARRIMGYVCLCVCMVWFSKNKSGTYCSIMVVQHLLV